MQQHFFAVPALRPETAQSEVNRFCAGHRVVAVERQFVAAGLDSFWALCVVVALGAGPLPDALRAPGGRPGARARIDYRQVLSSTFRIFGSAVGAMPA